MRKEPFRTWLAKSHSQKATTNRVSRAGRVERGLGVLGLPYRDLDDAYAADRLEGVIAALRALTAKAREGERPPPPLVQTSSQPEKQILSLMNAIQNYRRFRDEESGGTVRWPALEEMKTRFLDRAPDFRDFGQTEGTYWEMERQYKDAMLAEAQAIAASAPDDAAAGHGIYDALCPGDGPPLRWQTIDAIHRGDPFLAANFDSTLGVLARSDQPVPVAVTQAAATLEALRRTGVPSLAAGEILAIVFGIAAAMRPAESAFFKIRKAQKLLERLVEPPLFRGPAIRGEDVEAWLNVLKRIFAVMRDDWHWQPRDLLDVQGFAWAVLDDRWNVLGDDFEDSDTDAENQQERATMPNAVNLILYGPPGTGKTWRSAAEAVRLCDGLAAGDPLLDPARRADLKQRYDELCGQSRIGFVTFHQNFSYEDFVEGLRPPSGEEASGAGLRLDIHHGIFREMVTLAQSGSRSTGAPAIDLSGRRFFKMSLGRAGIEDQIYDSAIEGHYISLGWGGQEDWSDPKYDGDAGYRAVFDRWNEIEPGTSGNAGNISQVWCFRASIRKGDVVVISYGNSHIRAIGEVTGDYRFVPSDPFGYHHHRAVKWLRVFDEPIPASAVYDRALVQASCYRLQDSGVRTDGLTSLLGVDGSASGEPLPYVLIIDEINRANISRVFGELITLIEPDKRMSGANALKVKLPYSQDEFGIPANLHLVGTMNTADRSIALLDTALRRRFVFREIAPDPALLPDHIGGVPLRRVLEVINDRIEYLVDREHRIGHAFFMGDGGKDRDAIDATMRDKVIPLLQEYFFEDWSRVAAVLGEPEGEGGGFLDCRKLKDPTGQGGEDRPSWSVRPDFAPDAYDRLIHTAPAKPSVEADE